MQNYIILSLNYKKWNERRIELYFILLFDNCHVKFVKNNDASNKIRGKNINNFFLKVLFNFMTDN